MKCNPSEVRFPVLICEGKLIMFFTFIIFTLVLSAICFPEYVVWYLIFFNKMKCNVVLLSIPLLFNYIIKA